MNNYIKELKRRKVFTSAGLYAFSSFIIMQVANIIVPALRLPDWTNTLVLTLLILGFPIAMIFAWLYDRTPKGFIKTDDEFLNESFKAKAQSRFYGRDYDSHERESNNIIHSIENIKKI